MLTAILVSICAIVCLILSYRYAVARPEGFPPGPPKIPIFGSYLFLMMANFKYLHKALIRIGKFYKTDIVGFYIGYDPVVTVHDPQGVKEILTNSAFDGRPKTFLAQIRDPKMEYNGIFFKDGPIWHEQRRFILRYLRDSGFGRRFNELELVIKEEIYDLLDLIRNGPRYEHENQIVKPGGYRIFLPIVFNPASANSLFHIMCNERRPRAEQADLLKLIRMGMQFQRKADDYGKMLSIIPWIRFFFPNWSSYNPLMESNDFIYKYFERFIDYHIKTYDDSCERNFIDLYIKKMKQAEAEGRAEQSSFYRGQFIMSLIDFAFPAFTAVGVEISMFIQRLMTHPEVLARIQKEIDEVVGSGRLPTLDDRQYLHYTEATIRECLRTETLVPSDIPHRAVEDVELLGYKIPKDTIVVPSLYAYHSDESVWGDPFNFRPDRFLDDQGKLCLKKDVSFPFGAGKRLCAGETFARNILFLLLTSLCQNFNFVLGPGDKMPDVSKNMSGLIISPKDFWLQLEERNI